MVHTCTTFQWYLPLPPGPRVDHFFIVFQFMTDKCFSYGSIHNSFRYYYQAYFVSKRIEQTIDNKTLALLHAHMIPILYNTCVWSPWRLLVE